MSDIIKLLPDSVANQIAAGEVIQRPASVVKELVDNAIDAGATNIDILVKDAGRTLIQVTDNGRGMSPTDARMAFERHATSKIRNANDLFSISTNGFRGEALASIAAVAEVELKTKQENEELGTLLAIKASKCEKEEPTGGISGTCFAVKNLFFNIPARRKFLKKDATELKHIINEVQRAALANNNVAFKLTHNKSIVYNLLPSNKKKRIVDIFGKNMQQNLVKINGETDSVNINGYVGLPQHAKRTYGDQYIFVNKRYVRHIGIHKMVTTAYEQILSSNLIPTYFLFLEVDASTIDINIHPQKTEIKFENESLIKTFCLAAIREALGKNNIVPSIDFDTAGKVTMPSVSNFTEDSYIPSPDIKIDENYNPFEAAEQTRPQRVKTSQSYLDNDNFSNWQTAYSGLNDDFTTNKEPDKQNSTNVQQSSMNFDDSPIVEHGNFMQLKYRYIITPVKSGLMVIDQKLAHERILYEKFMVRQKNTSLTGQGLLFGETIELSADKAVLLEQTLPELDKLGIELHQKNDTNFEIKSIPEIIGKENHQEIIISLLDQLTEETSSASEIAASTIASYLAEISSIPHGKSLSAVEMENLVNDLFACTSVSYSPKGKTIFTIITMEQLKTMFN
ncbi:MAG: DNA mismatch repair endonuclease MutL [Bacteroidales bacterium]